MKRGIRPKSGSRAGKPAARRSRLAGRLFRDWKDVEKQIRRAGQVNLMLDFDGTIVAIAPRPDQVRLALPMRRMLAHLGKDRRLTVTVISGRRRAELRQFLPFRGIRCRGLYGWEQNARTSLPAASRRALQSAYRLLSQRLRLFPGLWIEDKKLSLSVHLKDVPADVSGWARREITRLLGPGARQFRILQNQRDVEILPRAIYDKGSAVRRILRKSRAASLPLYFGDDFSDEPAFQAARRGVTVHVGRARPTSAKYHLRNPAEVAVALQKLEAALR